MAKMSVREDEEKRSKISQTDIPNIGLQQSLRIAEVIRDQFAGRGAAPHNIARALDLSPTSGGWRNLCGASIAYGLTEGGYNAAAINLTDLGKQVVSPTQEGIEAKALQEAALRPRIPGEFFRRYDRAKFPRDDIAANVLADMGLPRERVAALVELLKENGRFVGFIQDTKTGPFVAIDDAPLPSHKWVEVRSDLEGNESNRGSGRDRQKPTDRVQASAEANSEIGRAPNNRVFITHGKNSQILEQIKKVVILGGFEPVVSAQRETAAKPVPDKVMDDMRSCSAAVIHVGAEGVLKDDDGTEYPQTNPNVLIEIGAAMALYRGRFILVVEEGVRLPSNLQGLYETRYKGSSIEFDTGMRILEALRGLRGSLAVV